MNVDQYFKDRSDLVARVLHERPFVRDWRVYGAGAFCLAGAMALQIWAANVLIDPGFFARTSTFLMVLAAAGVVLLSIAFAADVLIARVAIPSRDAVVERTLNQLLRIDGAIAHRTVGSRKNAEPSPN